MNKTAVLFHLREAKEELDRTVEEITANQSYNVGHLVVAMSHLYHHLNTAWNGRNASQKRHHDCAQIDFNKWRKFPQDAELLLD